MITIKRINIFCNKTDTQVSKQKKNMNCREFNKILPNYNDERFSPKQKEEFQNHINSCSKCAILFQKFSSTIELLKPKAEIEEHLFYYTRLKQRMENSNLQRESILIKLLSKKLVQPLIYLSSLIIAVYIGILIGSGSVNQNAYSELKNIETNYIQSYAEYQYLNDFDIEPIENLLLNSNNIAEE